MSQINQLIERARDYVYDRKDPAAFAEEVAGGDPAALGLLAEYLAGHGLVIARWAAAPRQAPGPWIWMDRAYLKAAAVTMKRYQRRLVVLGRGEFENPQELSTLGV